METSFQDLMHGILKKMLFSFVEIYHKHPLTLKELARNLIRRQIGGIHFQEKLEKLQIPENDPRKKEAIKLLIKTIPCDSQMQAFEWLKRFQKWHFNYNEYSIPLEFIIFTRSPSEEVGFYWPYRE